MKLRFRIEVALHRDPKSLACIVCGIKTYNARVIRSWAVRYDDRPPAEIPYVCPACRTAVPLTGDGRGDRSDGDGAGASEGG